MLAAGLRVLHEAILAMQSIAMSTHFFNNKENSTEPEKNKD